MSLPKEPRQKMINMMYLVLTALLALNVSAEILNAFKTVNQSLDKSNMSIKDQVANVKENFIAAMKEPKTALKANTWKPRADSITALSNELFDYLETIKMDLRVGAGEKNGDGKFKDDDLDVTTQKIIDNGKGEELYKKLQDYVEAVKKIDPEAADTSIIAKMIAVDLSVPKTESNFDWKNAYFHMVPTVAGLTILSKFQNDVRNTESKLNNYYFSKVSETIKVYDQFAVLVGANSAYFMPNQNMEISAGVGAFSSGSQPVVTVDGRNAPVDAEGIGKISFPVGARGKYKANVTVTYTKPDGSKETKNKTIDYEVGQPSEASIGLDKMNVFYIGVQNPITIGSAAGWDKTTVSGNNCSVSQTNGKGYVTVTSEGESTINVTAEGKTTPFKFRNYRLPTPPVSFGDLIPGPVATADVRAQAGLFAVDDNFIFDAQFRVTAFCMGVVKKGADPLLNMCSSSNALTGQMTSAIATITPGSTVTFYNIKVVGPDGQTRDARSISYICK